MTDLNGKTILITGGTSGIGQQTAVGLAKMGAHIIVTGRNQERGERGVTEIKQQSGNNNIDLLLADMTSLAEVRRLAAEVQDKYDRLDVLVNNVGLLPTERWETVDGIEATLAVNHVALFLFTHELLPILKASTPSRVINITGGSAGNGPIDFDNIQAEKSFVSLTHYTNSKKVMMAASYEFARRLEGSGVSLSVAYPGPAATNMTSVMAPDMVPFAMRLLWPIFKRFLSNADPAKAAKSSIYLASAPETEGTNGKYYNTNGKSAAWNPKLIEDGVPERVWAMTEEMLDMKLEKTFA